MFKLNRQLIICLGIVLVISMIIVIVKLWKRRKRRKEEQEQAEHLQREDALNRALVNPDGAKRKEAFEKQRRPFHVEYSQGSNRHSSDSDRKTFQLTEITELSKRTYMFRCDERVQIGNQFGIVTILPSDTQQEQVYCQILLYKKKNYIRSTGQVEVLLKRNGKQAIVTGNGLELRSKDTFMVGTTTYQIIFVH